MISRIVLVLLPAATLANLIDTHTRIEEAYAPPHFRSSLLQVDAVVAALNDFFSLEDVGQTYLGKILAWKGDLIQPAALFGLGVFAVYTLFRIVFTLLSGVIDLKAGILGRIFTSLENVNEAILNQLAGTDDDVTGERRKREIIDLAQYVYRAINKYE